MFRDIWQVVSLGTSIFGVAVYFIWIRPKMGLPAKEFEGKLCLVISMAVLILALLIESLTYIFSL